MSIVSIYALHRPDDEYRYIGLSDTPARRFSRHKRDAVRGSKLPVHRWMRKYPDVILTVIDICETPDQAQEMEKYWVSAAGGKQNLLNCTDGGEGIIGLKHTEEAKAKIAKAMRTAVRSPEYRANISTSKLGNTSHLGFRNTEESKAKMSVAKLGRTSTFKGCKQTDEAKAKMSAAKLGKPSVAMHIRWHVNRDLVNPECSFCELP